MNMMVLRPLIRQLIIASKTYLKVSKPTTISHTKRTHFPWFSSLSSRFTDSPILDFKYALTNGPYNVALRNNCNKHGVIYDQLRKIWCITKELGSRRLASGIGLGLKPKTCSSKIYSNHVSASPFASLKTSSLKFEMKHSSYLRSPRVFVRHCHTNRSSSKKDRELEHVDGWIEHVGEYFILYLLGLAFLITFIFAETIPYSKRRHFIIIPSHKDKAMGDRLFGKGYYYALPDTHPDSVRVRSISNRIVEALQKDLKFKRKRDSEFGEKLTEIDNSDEIEEKAVSWWRRSKLSTRHLDEIDWKVLVVKDDDINACCLPGGKIMINTGLLKHVESDAQIATVISHEVGHIVARHLAERLTRYMWVIVGMTLLILLSSASGPPPNPQGLQKMIEFVIDRPWSRRNEREADYIGLLVMASAGYDPREAPVFFELLDKLSESSDEKKSRFGDLFSTHPSGKKRAKLLSKEKVMNEAVSRYSNAIETRRNYLIDEDCYERNALIGDLESSVAKVEDESEPSGAKAVDESEPSTAKAVDDLESSRAKPEDDLVPSRAKHEDDSEPSRAKAKDDFKS